MTSVPASSRTGEPRSAHRVRSPTRQLRPGVRKAWLLAHVVISVGWFGGGYAMLVLGIAAMSDAGLRPAAYELMHLSDAAIMIPGSLGALVTGLVLGLRTKWRLLHHWWVVVKLLLTVGAMVFAYVYVARNVKTALATALETVGRDPGTDIGRLSGSVVAGSAVMLVVLFATTLLSVVKPWGRTRWGRKAFKRRPAGRVP